MAIYRAQNSFTGGEISPRLLGRVDLDIYRSSVALLENFFAHPHGGVSASPGTRYGWTVKDSTKVTRVIPFEVDQDTSYVIEFGVGYMRFGKRGARINIATPADWASGTTYAQGDLVKTGGVNYYSRQDGNTNKAPATETTWWYALTSAILELPHTYTEAQLPDVRYSQLGDVLWLYHPSHPTRRLERYAETDWILEDEVNLDGPFGLVNTTTTTLTPSGATGSVTVTASAVKGINNNQGFLATDVGRLLRIYNSGWKWGEITARASTTSITVLVIGGSFPTVAVKQWKLGKYSTNTGFPSVGTLHEARRWCGFGTDIDSSKTDILSDFGVLDTVVATDSCGFKTYSTSPDPIKWMTTARGGLAIGTSGGEWLLNGGGPDVPISPTQILARRHTSVGGSSIQPVNAGNAVLFVARTAKALHEFAYLFEDDAYQSPDLTLLAEHLLREYTITDMDYQRSQSIVWCVRSDGTLLGLTYRREDKVLGWHRRTTDGLFKYVCCVNEGSRDTPYMVVSRTVGAATVQMIEWMEDEFSGSDISDAYLVDCGVVYDGAATTTIAGLTHLEGETVVGLADGMVVSGLVVASGEAVLPYAAAKVCLGLSYDSILQTLPIEEPGLRDGTSIGRVKSVTKATILVSDSYGGKIGASLTEQDNIISNEGQVYGQAPSPFTGTKSIYVDSGYSTDKRVVIKRDKPLPLTINALVIECDVSEQ